eukprot:TRINITY_DN27446_c0_g1_i1.p1 TRINITY_DN27446_c0_g1~~TRINITY_DN27446_c0_g1_i1.p1  ORF type:complete len:225 (+),score=99.98 TRINITY_DN27446_c0_g1_i1:79-675(+)
MAAWPLRPGGALLAAAVLAQAAGAAARAAAAPTVDTPWGAVTRARHPPSCAADRSCVFTRRSLRRYSGGDKLMYVSLVSYVFDVSSAPEYYSSFGSYSYMAGKESARVLATMVESDGVDDVQTLADLSDEQWEELFTWIEKYNKKYTLVGRLADWDPGVTLDFINQKSGFSLKQPPPVPEPDPLLGGDEADGAVGGEL